jgi:16S rRNA C967 or C1407 C5-methylase (RsmB/RsmF family)
MPNKNEFNLSHLSHLLAGITQESGIARMLRSLEAQRAERARAKEVAAIAAKVRKVLEAWEADGSNVNESDFVRDLTKYLRKETGFEIEEHPNTREGQPDVLVEGCLAIEVKLNPRKSERDRCVGQCAAYSRAWMTWIVLIRAGVSVTDDLKKLLADHGLDHIEVWRFT